MIAILFQFFAGLSLFAAASPPKPGATLAPGPYDNPPAVPKWYRESWLRVGTVPGIGTYAMDEAQKARTETWLTAIPAQLWDTWFTLKEPSNDTKAADAEFNDYLTQIHKRSMRYIGYLSPLRDVGMRTHPEWQALNSDGSPAGSPEMPWGCLHSGLGNHLVEKLADAAKRFPIDGFWLDGYDAYFLCQCPACKDQFHKASGMELPNKIDWDSPAFRRYMEWHRLSMGDLARRLITRLRKVNPEIVVLYNASAWSTARVHHYSPFATAGDERFYLIPSPEHSYYHDNQSDGIAYTFKCRQTAGISGAAISEIDYAGSPHGLEFMPTPDQQLMNWAMGGLTEGWPLRLDCM